MRDKRRIRVLFKDKPESILYLKGTHTLMKLEDAIPYLESGVAEVYDSDYEILDDNTPYKKDLFFNRIYTLQDLKDKIDIIELYDGIGTAKAKALREYLAEDQLEIEFYPDE